MTMSGSTPRASRGAGKDKGSTNTTQQQQQLQKPAVLPQSQQRHERPQPTPEQLRLAQMINTDTRESNFDDPEMKGKIQQVVDLTQGSSDEAMVALHDCDGDVSAAVNLLLEGQPGQQSEWRTSGKKKKNNTAVKATEQKGDSVVEDGPIERIGRRGDKENVRGGGRGGPRFYRGSATRQGRGGGRDGFGDGNDRHSSDSDFRGRGRFRGGRGSRGRGGGGGTSGAGRPFRRDGGFGVAANNTGSGSSGDKQQIGTWSNTSNNDPHPTTTENWGETWDEDDKKKTMVVGSTKNGTVEEWGEEDWTGSLTESKVFTPSVSASAAVNDSPGSSAEGMLKAAGGTPPSTPPTAGTAGTSPQQYTLRQYNQHATDTLKMDLGLMSNAENNLEQQQANSAVTANSHPTLAQRVGGKSQRNMKGQPAKIPSKPVEMPGRGTYNAPSSLDVEFGVGDKFDLSNDSAVLKMGAISASSMPTTSTIGNHLAVDSKKDYGISVHQQQTAVNDGGMQQLLHSPNSTSHYQSSHHSVETSPNKATQQQSAFNSYRQSSSPSSSFHSQPQQLPTNQYSVKQPVATSGQSQSTFSAVTHSSAQQQQQQQHQQQQQQHVANHMQQQQPPTTSSTSSVYQPSQNHTPSGLQPFQPQQQQHTNSTNSQGGNYQQYNTLQDLEKITNNIKSTVIDVPSQPNSSYDQQQVQLSSALSSTSSALTNNSSSSSMSTLPTSSHSVSSTSAGKFPSTVAATTSNFSGVKTTAAGIPSVPPGHHMHPLQIAAQYNMMQHAMTYGLPQQPAMYPSAAGYDHTADPMLSLLQRGLPLPTAAGASYPYDGTAAATGNLPAFQSPPAGSVSTTSSGNNLEKYRNVSTTDALGSTSATSGLTAAVAPQTPTHQQQQQQTFMNLSGLIHPAPGFSYYYPGMINAAAAGGYSPLFAHAAAAAAGSVPVSAGPGNAPAAATNNNTGGNQKIGNTLFGPPSNTYSHGFDDISQQQQQPLQQQQVSQQSDYSSGRSSYNGQLQQSKSAGTANNPVAAAVSSSVADMNGGVSSSMYGKHQQTYDNKYMSGAYNMSAAGVTGQGLGGPPSQGNQAYTNSGQPQYMQNLMMANNPVAAASQHHSPMIAGAGSTHGMHPADPTAAALTGASPSAAAAAAASRSSAGAQKTQPYQRYNNWNN